MKHDFAEAVTHAWPPVIGLYAELRAPRLAIDS